MVKHVRTILKKNLIKHKFVVKKKKKTKSELHKRLDIFLKTNGQ